MGSKRRIIKLYEVCEKINHHYLWELAPFFPEIDFNPLKKGTSKRILCPLHKEKKPSFHFSPERGIFFCWGCHLGGSLITFYRLMKHETFLASVVRLAKFFNIKLVWTSSIEKCKKDIEEIEDIEFLPNRFNENDMPF